jgi:hypothetical protein
MTGRGTVEITLNLEWATKIWIGTMMKKKDEKGKKKEKEKEDKEKKERKNVGKNVRMS